VVQQKGYVLYVYCKNGTTPCKTPISSSKWPPMIAYHNPVAGKGISQKHLGTTTINGQKVVTYFGQPLYRYSGDKKPGQARGEAKGNRYVLTQFGQPQPPSGY